MVSGTKYSIKLVKLLDDGYSNRRWLHWRNVHVQIGNRNESDRLSYQRKHGASLAMCSDYFSLCSVFWKICKYKFLGGFHIIIMFFANGILQFGRRHVWAERLSFSEQSKKLNEGTYIVDVVAKLLSIISYTNPNITIYKRWYLLLLLHF